MMQDWNGYRESLLESVGDLAKQSPDLMRSFAALDNAAAKSGHLDAKTHELIAVAVAVTTRCDGCIAVHTKKAAEAGASLGEIAEALTVAVALNAGAALTYSARVLESYQQLPGHVARMSPESSPGGAVGAAGA
jgi:AhpD family alkylhydroperoxidase